MNSLDKVIKACKDFEPIEGFILNESEARGVEITALQSIAISLKRIADSMEKANKPIAMTTEEALMYQERIAFNMYKGKV
jgi:hypothetical protein